jgi:hypothetical protein
MLQHDAIIIGLAGRAGAGKDTAGYHLVDAHRFHAVAFADLINDLADVLITCWDVDYAVLHERSMKEQPIYAMPGAPSPRRLKQDLGDIGRAWHPDFWVQALARSVGLHDLPRSSPVHDRIVITDVRYPNEAAWVVGLGGVVLRVVRPGAAPVRDHSSEQHVDSLAVSLEISNDGGIEHLTAELELALARLGVRL